MEIKPEEQYLPEDRDLLTEIDTTRTSTGEAESKRIHKLASVQTKAILRNRKTADDLNKSTEKYSMALITFAFAQIILGTFQFLFETGTSTHPVLGFFYVVSATTLILYTSSILLRNRKGVKR